MTLDAGDSYEGRIETTTVPSDGSGSAGDAVEWSSSQVSQMAGGSSGTFYGVLAEDAPAAGEDVRVHTGGKCVANVDSGATAGQAGVSGSNAGQLASGSSNAFLVADEGAETQSGTAPVDIR